MKDLKIQLIKELLMVYLESVDQLLDLDDYKNMHPLELLDFIHQNNMKVYKMTSQGASYEDALGSALKDLNVSDSQIQEAKELAKEMKKKRDTEMSLPKGVKKNDLH